MPALADPPPQQQQAPAPTPEPQAPPQPSSIEAFDDQFKDLDHTPDPEPPKPEPQPAPKADATPKDAPKPDKPEAAPKEAPKEEPENYEPPAQMTKPNELRGWALRMGKGKKESDARAKEAESKVADLQRQIEEIKRKPAVDPVASKQLTEAQKRIEDYEQKMRMVRYEQSAEYQEKHEKPIKRAEAEARELVESLTVEVKQKVKNHETGEETESTVSTRPGTWKDFYKIYNLPPAEARKEARALFGEDADDVMDSYKDIHRKYKTAFDATEEYRQRGKEIEQQTEAEKKREADFMEQGWEKANTAFIAKSPQDFDERPDDAEGNQLLAKARSFVDLFMSDERGKYPLPQQLLADARIRNWASAFTRNQRDLKKLRAELEQANATIEQLRGSGPGKIIPGDGQAPAQQETLQQAFDRMVPA